MPEIYDQATKNGAVDEDDQFIDDDGASDEGGLFGSGSEDEDEL